MSMQYFQTVLKTPPGDGLEEFMLLNGRYSNFTKETFFIRYLSAQSFGQDQARLQAWHERNTPQRSGFVFTPALKSPPSAAEVGTYAALYQDGTVRFPFRFENKIWQDALEQSFAQVTRLFQETRGRSEASILRNFSIKMLYWMDTYFPLLFVETAKMNRFPKFACGGTVKLTEYLFLYLLFLLGCDVLYLSPLDGAGIDSPTLLALSTPVQAKPPQTAAPKQTEPAPQSGRAVISMDRIRRSDRHSVPPAPKTVLPPRPVSPSRPVQTPASAVSTGGLQSARQPLEFEELAKFASSVVMLKVFDQNDQCFKTGSGVIISEKGYVLTNLHVVNGGRYYGILLEEETDVFYTDELIKYHQDYDLAVLRMEKHRKPVPIASSSQKLVRGQKVVAIGSPLGLFNSVSDGIISGFRDMEKVSMVQFTAPVSHGSSGGALLNLYGELVGLITAGYDDGQNLNLAVGFQTIAPFVRGLL